MPEQDAPERNETGTDPEETLEEEQEVKGKEKKVSAKKFNALKEDYEKAKAEAEHWKNEYYKAYADTQNLRRSLEAEQRTMYRYRAEGFLTELLPALDAFHMALEHPAPTKEAQNYQVGFTYIYNQIIAALTNEGVKEILPKVGDPFDHATMNALEVEETEEMEPNRIVKVHAKGYMLHDRLIKAAMVTVSKKPEPKEETPLPEGDETPAEA